MFQQKNVVWHIVVFTPSKLLGAFILKMKPKILLDAIGTILRINAPIGLETLFTDTKWLWYL